MRGKHGNFREKAWLAQESALLGRARRGDRAAVAELYHQFAGPLFAQVLMPRLGNRSAAEDALSETFRHGFERLSQFDERGVSIYFWFARIAVNKATDMHRVKARTRRALASFDELLAPIRPSPTRPEAEVMAAERASMLRERVKDTLADLRPRYAKAIRLRFFEERSREQCADELGVKIGTFDVLLLRALRSFRKAWELA